MLTEIETDCAKHFKHNRCKKHNMCDKHEKCHECNRCRPRKPCWDPLDPRVDFFDVFSKSCCRCKCDNYDEKHYTCQKKEKKEKKKVKTVDFIITTPLKAGHPWENHITETEDAFAVTYPDCSVVKGGTIYLKRGQKYTFNIKQTDTARPFEHLLFFTTDPTGGKPGGKVLGNVDPTNYNPPTLPGTPAPFGAGKKGFVVTSAFPEIFYYQCKNHQFMGGLIFVEN